MYGETVDGIDGHRFEEELAALKRERGADQDLDLTADDLVGLVGRFKEIYESETGRPFPQDARGQLARAVEAVFQSWDTPRAQVYRRAHDIPDDLGTAVNVVQMVFGNKGETSATGVAFTRDPSTGEPGVFGEFLVNAQGEDVVAGIRTPEPLARMEEILPEAFTRVRRDDPAPRGALPRRPGHRVHRRGREALPAPDPDGEADGGFGAEDRRRHGRGGLDLARGGGRQDRPCPARPAPAPDARPEHVARRRRQGPERLARGGGRLDRLRRRHRRGPRPGRGEGDSRPLGDDPGRHQRDDLRPGDPHRPRWDDVARRRRRTGDGEAVRGGLRRSLHRRGDEDGHARRPQPERRRRDHDRRRHRQRDRRRGRSSSRRRSTRTSRRSSSGRTGCGA